MGRGDKTPVPAPSVHAELVGPTGILKTLRREPYGESTATSTRAAECAAQCYLLRPAGIDFMAIRRYGVKPWQAETFNLLIATFVDASAASSRRHVVRLADRKAVQANRIQKTCRCRRTCRAARR